MTKRVYDAPNYDYRTVQEEWKKGRGRIHKRHRDEYREPRRPSVAEQKLTPSTDAPQSIPFAKSVSLRKGYEGLPSQLIGTVCQEDVHVQWGVDPEGSTALVQFKNRGVRKIPLHILVLA